MNDQNGTALAALAAALAPYLAQHMGGNGGNPAAQNGGTFGNPQTGGAMNVAPTGAMQAQQAQTSVISGTAGNMFGGAPATNTTSVTPDMIQQLITPLVQNEQVKQALTAQMQQMGIQNLPDARPEQLAELYQRFQNVEQQAKQAGLIGGTPGGAPSII